jgi:DnaJ-class molecular chaperone
MLTLGKEVTRTAQPAANRGWKKYRVKCEACGGSGLQPAPTEELTVRVCGGCNGHGKVIVWRKES